MHSKLSFNNPCNQAYLRHNWFIYSWTSLWVTKTALLILNFIELHSRYKHLFINISLNWCGKYHWQLSQSRSNKLTVLNKTAKFYWKLYAPAAMRFSRTLRLEKHFFHTPTACQYTFNLCNDQWYYFGASTFLWINKHYVMSVTIFSTVCISGLSRNIHLTESASFDNLQKDVNLNNYTYAICYFFHSTEWHRSFRKISWTVFF